MVLNEIFFPEDICPAPAQINNPEITNSFEKLGYKSSLRQIYYGNNNNNCDKNNNCNLLLPLNAKKYIQ